MLQLSGSTNQSKVVRMGVQEDVNSLITHYKGTASHYNSSNEGNSQREQQNSMTSDQSLFRAVDNNCYVCRLCSKVFAARSSIVRHLRTHTGDRPFTCKICKKGFRQRAHLRVHSTVHSGEKPFPCHLCERAFTQKHSLKDHLSRLHQVPL